MPNLISAQTFSVSSPTRGFGHLQSPREAASPACLPANVVIFSSSCEPNPVALQLNHKS